jgi:hypothetical protein
MSYTVTNARASNDNGSPLQVLPELSDSAGLYRVNGLDEVMRRIYDPTCPALVVYAPELQPADLEKICLLLGKGVQGSRAFGQVRHIRYTGNRLSVAESLDAHPMHTDGTFDVDPPRYFLLYVVEQDDGDGGTSLLLPTQPILMQQSRDSIQALLEEPVRFERKDPKGFTDSWVGPLLTHEPDGLNFRWRYDDMVFPRPLDPSGRFLPKAILDLRKAIEAATPIQYKAAKGELLLVPNRRYLHGRTKLNPGSQRHLLRAWIA